MSFSGRPSRFLLTPLVLDQQAPELTRLAGPGWDMITPTIPFTGLSERLAVIHRTLTGRVADSVNDGAVPVSIAGDCCAAIATLAGLQRGGVAPVIVWLDAHGDFNTPETTITGFLGGMPLAMITGRGDLHLDLDILEPSDAPAMTYPVPGGPPLAALVALGERLRASGRLAAVSVTTWDLAADHNRKTERACLAVLHALTGGP
jgi:arginase family enzyme